ncbi:hypothetical protein Ddye_023367 [Dipteronia dyeriana]|uniref:Uncharacterized protein n=1 Tax=Dipteronia dyeriana TaxID=168575 RepID=A0AAD9TSW9_9ROSI|nr:hypothetical protein Ddye_023367 [Dipteronia dyeriana]
MTLKMVDNSSKTLYAVVEDVRLDIYGLKVPIDFVILKVKEEESKERDWKLLLGRSFIVTAGMEVNVVSWRVSLKYGGRDGIQEKESLSMEEVIFDGQMLKEVARDCEHEEENKRLQLKEKLFKA